MEDIFRFTDDLGPAKVVHVYEPALGLRAVLVVDNVACGPSIGGLRMAPDVSTPECARLARAMMLKNAAAGLPHGGGKTVLFGDPRMPRDRKERLIRVFAHALRNEEDYIFGPDMGTDESCMAWVKLEGANSPMTPGAASLACLELLSQTSAPRDRLAANTRCFRRAMAEAGFAIRPGDHPIVPIMLGDAKLAHKMAADLLERGIYVVGFSYPVVPKGEARIRVHSAAHEPAHLEQAVGAFVQVGRAHNVL
jgi:Glu/Leu/Phe/Val dehydrogenase, dimerisation domain/Aminotransferase class I and II